MSNKPSKPESKPKSGSIRPQTKPKQVPRSSVPPKAGPVFSRPMGASSTQRKRRIALRHGQPTGTITAKKNADEGEVLLFGTIGEDWFGQGITANSFD